MPNSYLCNCFEFHHSVLHYMSPVTISENTYFLVLYHMLIFNILYISHTVFSLYLLSADSNIRTPNSMEKSEWTFG